MLNVIRDPYHYEKVCSVIVRVVFPWENVIKVVYYYY